MDITCGRCRRSYFVPDDLVHGRTFRAKCSQCGHAFAVDVPERRGGVAFPRDDLPATNASALPDLASDLADADLSFLEEGAARADAQARAEDEVVLLTVQRSRRRGAAALVAGALVIVAVGGGLASWAVSRWKPAEGPARARAEAAGAAGPILDAGGLAFKERPPEAEAPAPAPVPRAKRPRIDRSDRRLLDLLARKDDVSVVPLVEDEPGGSAQSALDPAAAEKVLSSNRKAFDACISKALRLSPGRKLARRATLLVTVNPAGSVGRAWIMEEEIDRTDLGLCLTQTAQRMVFPAFDGEPVDIAMPLALSAAY